MRNIVTSIVHRTGFPLVQSLAHFALVLMCSIIVGTALASCKSTEYEDGVAPQANNDGTYFSQCKIKDYNCYGNTANITALEGDQKGNPIYSFVFAMKVNNDPYQDLAVTVSLKSFPGKGKYTLTSSNSHVNYSVLYTTKPTMYSSSKVTGTMEVTEYQQKKYVAGTFAIYSDDGTNSLELKEGKFKVEADF